MTEISLRDATPDHAALMADLMYQTGPATFDYLFADRATAEAHLARHWIRRGGAYSHVHATVANADGRVVGLELGYGAEVRAAQWPETQAQLRADMSAAELAAFSRRAEATAPLTAAVPDGAYFVHELAVVEDGRGRGWGRLLLEAAFARARAEGFASLRLDVDSDNPALAFYLRLGMEIEIETRLPRLEREHGLAACYRMVKHL